MAVLRTSIKMSRRSDDEMSQCRRSLISVNTHGLISAPLPQKRNRRQEVHAESATARVQFLGAHRAIMQVASGAFSMCS